MKLILFLLLLTISISWAEEKVSGAFLKELNTFIGMSSISLTDLSKSSGGSFSGTSVNLGLEYPFYKSIRRSYFIRSSVPVVSELGTGLYSLLVGLNLFNDSLSGAYKMVDGTSSVLIRPKTQYFWGPHIGSGLAVYRLETAKKSDFSLLLGLQGGLIRQINERWAVKLDAFAAKGFGINSSQLSYSASLGVITQLE